MELRHLQHFIAVAETGKFTTAAERMHIVQSGISVSIRELESELGSTLFNRTTRRISLTDSGQVFLEHARASLAMLHEGVEAVQAQAGIVRGRLHVGILQSLGPYIEIPELLKRFRSTYPHVEFAVRTANTEQIPALVRSGFFDLSFHALVAEETFPGLEIIPFVQDTLVAICSTKHILSESKTVRLERLAQESFVDLSSERALRKLVEKIFVGSQIDRSTIYEVSDVDTLLHFVSWGLGVAIVPAKLARSAVEKRKVASLELFGKGLRLPRWKIVILTRRHGRNVPGRTTVELFLDTMVELKGAATPAKSDRLKRVSIANVGEDRR